MLNTGVEGFSRRVLGEPEDGAAPDAGQPASPGDQREAHATQDIRVGALARAAPWGGDGVELEAAGDVVGEDAELLPGTVGAVWRVGTTSSANSPLSSAIVFSCAPRPPMNA